MCRLVCALVLGVVVGLFFGLWGGCHLCRRDPLEGLDEEQMAALVGALQLLANKQVDYRRELRSRAPTPDQPSATDLHYCIRRALTGPLP